MNKQDLKDSIACLRKESLKDYDIKLLSDIGVINNISYIISTGIPQIDAITGIGGLPSGRLIELIGKEGSGKTTFALHLAAQTIKREGLVLYIDGEYSLDLNYAHAIGIIDDFFILSQPTDLEQAFKIMEETILEIRSKKSLKDCPFLIIYDSLISLAPKDELDEEYGSERIGLFARRFGQALRKLNGIVSKNHVIVLFINQLRDNIGVMYGAKETSPGGRALKFYASMRFDMRQKSTNKIEGSSEILIRTIKNKLAIPFKEAIVKVVFGLGFDFSKSLLEQAYAEGLITRETTQSFLFEGTKVSHKAYAENKELQLKLASLLKFNLRSNIEEIITDEIMN